MSKIYPYRTIKPAVEVISLEQARAWLNMDIEGVTFADNVIRDLLESAIDYVETEINVSLGVSTYEWCPECFPTDILDTFFVQSILSISRTEDEDYVAIDPANYKLVKVSERRTKIVWASAYDRSGENQYSPYKVVFTAGYPEDKIPPRLKQAIRALIAAWYNGDSDPVSEKKTLSDKIMAPFVIPYA